MFRMPALNPIAQGRDAQRDSGPLPGECQSNPDSGRTDGRNRSPDPAPAQSGRPGQKRVVLQREKADRLMGIGTDPWVRLRVKTSGVRMLREILFREEKTGLSARAGVRPERTPQSCEFLGDLLSGGPVA